MDAPRLARSVSCQQGNFGITRTSACTRRRPQSRTKRREPFYRWRKLGLKPLTYWKRSRKCAGLRGSQAPGLGIKGPGWSGMTVVPKSGRSWAGGGLQFVPFSYCILPIPNVPLPRITASRPRARQAAEATTSYPIAAGEAVRDISTKHLGVSTWV